MRHAWPLPTILGTMLICIKNTSITHACYDIAPSKLSSFFLSSSTNYIFSFQYFDNFFASLLQRCFKSYPTWTFPCVYRPMQKLWKHREYLISFDIIFPFLLSTTFKVHQRRLSWKVTAFFIRFQNFRVLFAGFTRLPEKVYVSFVLWGNNRRTTFFVLYYFVESRTIHFVLLR